MLVPRAIYLVVLLVSTALLSLSCSVKPNFVDDNAEGAGGTGGAGTTADGGTDTAKSCMIATDCPGADSACYTRACVAGKCAPELTPRGKQVPMREVLGDCRAAVCDGAGNEILPLNALDAPADTSKGDCKKPACGIDGSVIQQIDDSDSDDGNPCTDDSCSQGAPTHAQRPDNSSCGVCQRCTLGNCVNCTGVCLPDNTCPLM